MTWLMNTGTYVLLCAQHGLGLDNRHLARLMTAMPSQQEPYRASARVLVTLILPEKSDGPRQSSGWPVAP